ncbi:hypothetical protein Scep_027935 [Stephania cephalantha]|uniref:Uncharacterized protein n=1 Tax=Stephania cephalantha TaxID=152367 RepID=A0AAP0EGC3_9MAGN
MEGGIVDVVDKGGRVLELSVSTNHSLPLLSLCSTAPTRLSWSSSLSLMFLFPLGALICCTLFLRDNRNSDEQ